MDTRSCGYWAGFRRGQTRLRRDSAEAAVRLGNKFASLPVRIIDMTKVATLVALILLGSACTGSSETPASEPQETKKTLALDLVESKVHPKATAELEIHFPFPRSHTWGLETQIEEKGNEGWEPLYYVITDPNEDTPAPYYRYGRKNTAIPGIGFESTESPVELEIRIPPLDPGSYRICKDLSPNEPTGDTYQSVTACDHFRVIPIDAPSH